MAASFISDTFKSKKFEFPNKGKLCEFFTQSYLRTVPVVKPDLNDEQWQMKIAIETDLYNMCLLDLNKEALKNYKPSAIEKYQK